MSSKPRLKADWHRANRMPAKPTLDQRIAWHVAHRENCGCRPIPENLLVVMRERKLA